MRRRVLNKKQKKRAAAAGAMPGRSPHVYAGKGRMRLFRRKAAIGRGERKMEIVRLDRENYAGKKLSVRYETNGYYDIRACASGFEIAHVSFEAPREKSFDDVFFGEWLEEPVGFGAFENEQMAGYVEGSPERWNNRFRISNICVFENARRGQGIGTLLMETITKAAEAVGARMLVLETQSCNENAIAFYQKMGFSIIGFDLYAYSNADPERREVRIEMGKKLEQTASEILRRE